MAPPADSDGPVQSGLTIAIVGATGSVGRDVTEALERSSVPVVDWVFFASAASAGERIEVGDKSWMVQPTPADLSASELLSDVDLVVFTAPSEVARAHAPALQEAGIAVLDVGGALAERAPLVVPVVDLRPLARFVETRAVSSPSGAAVLLATVLAPLFAVGAQAVRGTVLLSASVAGKAAVEELSAQVVSLFNHGEPPRKAFPTGLAFDLLVDPAAAPPQGPSAGKLSIEVAAVLGVRPEQFAVQIAWVPLFTGLAASLFVAGPEPLDADRASEALSAVPTVDHTGAAPGPRRLAGSARAHVGALTPTADGGLSFWATADNLRFAASGNAVAIASALHRARLL